MGKRGSLFAAELPGLEQRNAEILRRLERYGHPLGSHIFLKEQHGTRASYREGGCRCDLCWEAGATVRKAEAERQRESEREHRMHPEMQRYARRHAG
jgi:hypothetical protein